ncbi:hypothetical protein GCM10010339_56060 [Streptomyces alanosinicus]|uniref:NADP-dependent oxidoreductase domain-containing protein n=1 Tax=Streptomyces alanosinicus TaxID=68171 RepID=A0A919D3X1_9ACTN|nr:hypothetical protein GCM10010339_56060 [Streptomyces alanosinicus]
MCGHMPVNAGSTSGTWSISAAYGQTDEALIDTADMYGVGANEEFLAPFVAAHRDEIILATKFGIGYRADDPAYRAIRNDPGYLRTAVEASPPRLNVEVIGLYYMHRRDPVIPLAESVGAMAELVRASLFSRDVERSVVGAAAEPGVAFVPYSPLGGGFLTGSFSDADKEL